MNNATIEMNPAPHTSNRCRLVLIAPDVDEFDILVSTVRDALKGGDVASVIIPQRNLDEHTFQNIAEALVPIIQQADAAAIICGDTRILGRTRADGLHVLGAVEELDTNLEKFSPQYIVGGGSAKDRHTALSIGDVQPDYIFFGKLDGDIKPEPHPKNLALGAWWAEFVEIPCITMGGNQIDSVLTVADAMCDFVALNQAIFSDPSQAALKVAEANAMLDEKAPRFDD